MIGGNDRDIEILLELPVLGLIVHIDGDKKTSVKHSSSIREGGK